MINVGNIGIRNCILCEDIRQEKSEKFILAGVFSGDIYVEKMPANIPLAFFLLGNVRKPGETKLWLKLSGPGKGSAVIEASITSTVENEEATMVLPRMEILMESEGVFKLEASSNNKTWTTLSEKKVNQKTGLWSLNPTVVEQPSEQSQPDAPDSSSPPEPFPQGSPKRRRRI